MTVGAGVAGGAAVTELERVEFRRLLMEFRGLVMIVGGATTATRTVVGVVAGERGAVAGGEVTGGGGGAVTGGAVTGGGGGHSTKPVGEVGSSHRSACAEMAGNVRNAAVAAAPSTPIRAQPSHLPPSHGPEGTPRGARRTVGFDSVNASMPGCSHHRFGARPSGLAPELPKSVLKHVTFPVRTDALDPTHQRKPVARRGRKATGVTDLAGLPKW